MPSVPLKVTHPPADDPGSAPGRSAGPLFRGNGDVDYVCGHCGAVMAAGMGPRQHVIVDTARCSGCGAENEFPVELRA
jgi:hypothetical protein